MQINNYVELSWLKTKIKIDKILNTIQIVAAATESTNYGY